MSLLLLVRFLNRRVHFVFHSYSIGFRENLGTTTEENSVPSCFSCTVADALPLCCASRLHCSAAGMNWSVGAGGRWRQSDMLSCPLVHEQPCQSTPPTAVPGPRKCARYGALTLVKPSGLSERSVLEHGTDGRVRVSPRCLFWTFLSF